MNDYIPQLVVGDYDTINTHSIFKNTYTQLHGLNWADTYFLLNVQLIERAILPADCVQAVISFHTEYYNYYTLVEFFNKYPNCKFLLLSDGSNKNTWPDNVTYVQWVTWADQLDVAISTYGVNTDVRLPDKKLSSLSSRHEFHKAAITSYLINNYTSDEYIMSWHDIRYSSVPYYLDGNFEIHSNRIRNYINSERFKNIIPTTPDGYTQKQNNPISNGNWHTDAYTDCVINLTNETIFNSKFQYNGMPYEYTTPYLTEKTWKPLMARQAFIPIGQYNTIGHLSELGLVFDYGLDLSFDQRLMEIERIEGIYDLLDAVKEIDIDILHQQVQPVADFNLNLITSGTFRKNCKDLNMYQVDKIEDWINK